MIQGTKNYFSYIFLAMFFVIAFFLLLNYPLPVVIRSINNFISNFSVMELLNNNNFLVALLMSFFIATLFILMLIFTGDKRGDIFLWMMFLTLLILLII